MQPLYFQVKLFINLQLTFIREGGMLRNQAIFRFYIAVLFLLTKKNLILYSVYLVNSLISDNICQYLDLCSKQQFHTPLPVLLVPVHFLLPDRKVQVQQEPTLAKHENNSIHFFIAALFVLPKNIKSLNKMDIFALSIYCCILISIQFNPKYFGMTRHINIRKDLLQNYYLNQKAM